MADAIIRYRPWIPINGKIHSKNRVHGNAVIAIMHGLSLCAIDNKQPINKFMDTKNFKEWFEIFEYILSNKQTNPDMMILVFETIRNYTMIIT